MNRKRLRILAKFLRGVKRKHFNLNTWCEIDGGKIVNGAIKAVGCQTTACAVGWAASIPSFRRDGLRLYRDSEGSVTPRYKRIHDEDKAVPAFFDLDIDASINLFSPISYSEREINNPVAVAERIEALLAKP